MSTSAAPSPPSGASGSVASQPAVHDRNELLWILADIEAGQLSPDEARKLLKEQDRNAHPMWRVILRALLGR